MKRTVVLILACIFILPFAARSQNEGIKAVSNPQPVEKTFMHPKITKEMALIQEQGTSGGATSPSGLSTEKGGMYLEPGWASGSVMLSDQSVMDNIMLRYDIYNQQIQFIRENDTLAFSKPEEVKYFILDGKKIIYTDYQTGGIIKKGYFEILSDGNCRLMMHRKVKYHLDPESKPNLKEDIYVRECEYYISKNGDMAKPIRACRKSVLCAFNDKEGQVKDYMETNNLKMNTCDQLKQVVAFYNSLL